MKPAAAITKPAAAITKPDPAVGSLSTNLDDEPHEPIDAKIKMQAINLQPTGSRLKRYHFTLGFLYRSLNRPISSAIRSTPRL